MLAIKHGIEDTTKGQLEKLKLILDKMSDISKEAPTVPERFWSAANKEITVNPAHHSPIGLSVRSKQLPNEFDRMNRSANDLDSQP